MSLQHQNNHLYSLHRHVDIVNRVFITNNINGDHQSLVKLMRESKFCQKKGDILVSLGNFFGGDGRNAYNDNEALAKIANNQWCHLLFGENEFWLNECYLALKNEDQGLLDLCIEKQESWLGDYITSSGHKNIFSSLNSLSLFLSATHKESKIGFSTNAPSYSDWSMIDSLLSEDKIVKDLLFNPNNSMLPAKSGVKGLTHLYTTGTVPTIQHAYNCTVIPTLSNKKQMYAIPFSVMHNFIT